MKKGDDLVADADIHIEDDDVDGVDEVDDSKPFTSSSRSNFSLMYCSTVAGF